MPVVFIVLGSIGVGAFLAVFLSSTERPVPPVHEPDLPLGTSQPTRHSLINKILPLLRRASDSSGVPLGLLVGWITRESGGRLEDITARDERGLFQIDPRESKTLKLDHQRLSTDLVYSINGGLALIASYMDLVDKLDVAPKGTSYYWLLVKLGHTVGSFALQTIIAMARDAGEVASWGRLERFAFANESKIKSATRHSPSKWFPLVDEVHKVGQPFGFGSQDVLIGAGTVYTDIVDPLDCL